MNARVILCVCFIGMMSLQTLAQDAKSSIESKHFSYQAQTMYPTKGPTRQLEPGYSFELKGDTLICNLPYMGRVYTPTIGGDAGFHFTATGVEYSTKVRKKGGWDVRIKAKDKNVQRQFDLTVSEDGSASLTVTSSDRESARYRGTLSK